MLEDRYPRISKRFGRLAAYIQLVRPFTLLAPLLAGILGVLASIDVITLDSLLAGIYTGITLALAQATGQVINQYADVELDRRIKPYRPLPSGLISKEEAVGIAWLLALFSIARAFTLSTIFGLVVIVLIFFAVFYSLSPFSPRKIDPFLNILWMAVSRGFIPIIAVWSIYGAWRKAIPYALLGFIWVLGFQGTKDVEDSSGDWTFKIKTIFNIYGLEGMRILMVVCLSLYLCICRIFRLPIMSLLTVLAVICIYGVTKKSRFTENNYGWMGFYTGLGLIFVLMFINERLAFL